MYSGNTKIVSSDDGINAANSDLDKYDFSINIYGGYWYVDALGDGLDSNGDICMNGGIVEVFGGTAADETAVDMDGTWTQKSGTIMAIGQSGMLETPDNGKYIMFGSSGMGGNQGGQPGNMGNGQGSFGSFGQNGPGGQGGQSRLGGQGDQSNPTNQGGQSGAGISISAGDKIVIKDASENTVYSITAIKNATSVIYSDDELAVDIQSDSTSVEVGDVVKLTAQASGGAGGYTYSFLVRNKETNVWYRFSDFKTSNTLIWTASSAGAREFYVEVKDSNGTVVRSSAHTFDVSAASQAELSITGKASASSVNVGSKITISASASGGSGDYTYSFLVKNKETNVWYRFSDFKSASTLTWTAASAGTREFYIEVKDGTGTVERSSSVTVNVTN